MNLVALVVVVDDDNEEVFSDEEFEAEMKQRQKILTQNSQVGQSMCRTLGLYSRGRSTSDTPRTSVTGASCRSFIIIQVYTGEGARKPRLKN